MNDGANMAAVRTEVLRQDGNLKIARSEDLFLNAAVVLARAQPSHRLLPASAGGHKS